MSYCRWSSMNGQCDVYVYESCYGGWVTHVAGRRQAFPPIPSLPLKSFGMVSDDGFKTVRYKTRWHKLVSSAYTRIWMFWENYVHGVSSNLIPHRDIGLPYDGETITDSTPKKCIDTLLMLRNLGYNVPDHAINRLLEEWEEMKND